MLTSDWVGLATAVVDGDRVVGRVGIADGAGHRGRVRDDGAGRSCRIHFDNHREVHRSARGDGLTGVESAGEGARGTDSDGVAGPICRRSEGDEGGIGRNGDCKGGVRFRNGTVVGHGLGIGNVVALRNGIGSV